MSQPPRRLVFDLTTSAQWGRPPVGVVQTERELGRNAPAVTDRPVEYSVYDGGGTLHRLRSDVAEAVLGGEAMVQLRAPTGPRGTVQRLARPLFRRNSRADAADRHPGIPLAEASDAVLELSAGDVLVSCGADWESKNLDTIRASKDRRGFAYVSVCYDVIPWKHPEFWPPGVAEQVVSHYARLPRVADLVMCISRATERDYHGLCDALGVAHPSTTVFRLGDVPSVSPTETPLPSTLEAGRYVLCVGSLEPRKNHRLLYQLWDRLVRDGSLPKDVKLVLVAGARWMTDDLVLEMNLNTAVRDRIVTIDHVSEAGLHALYSHSLLTVYPSFAEGWGLPVAESLGHGKVCLASNRGALPEISDVTVLLDPYDFYAWRDAIVRYTKDEQARLELEGRIRESYEPTTWRTSARSFFDAALSTRPS